MQRSPCLYLSPGRCMLVLQQQQVVSRRAVSLTGLGALLLSMGGPAQAGLLDSKQDKNEIYTADTVGMLQLLNFGHLCLLCLIQACLWWSSLVVKKQSVNVIWDVPAVHVAREGQEWPGPTKGCFKP